MKKIVSAVVALALALTIVAPVATSAQAVSTAYTFSSNLTVGSRGADVVALQTFLESKGLITIPAGVAKGYFGALTKSAVAAYQSMKGITPTAGYFGPITRQAVQADMAAMGSTSTSTVPGCVAGALYSSTTGQPCTTSTTTTTTGTGTVTTSGTEGSLNVTLAATPTNNANIQTQTDVPVYGLQFKAQLADVVVQTVDLQISDVNTGNNNSTENPGTLINTIKVWDGSNVIATLPVNISTFTRDQNQIYYVRLSGLNFLVPKDNTKVLTISFSTNSIDTDRVVTIQGYNSSSVRAVSGNNISSFYDISGSAFQRTQTFKKPGTSTLTLSAATSPLRSQNYRVNSTDTTIAPVLNFNVKSQTGDSQILSVTATSTLTGVNGTSLVYYLYDGSTLLSSKTGSTTVTFDNLSDVVSQDVTKTLSVKVGFPATITGAYVATTTISQIQYQTPNGSTATLSSTPVTGVGQYVYSAAPQFVLASTPTIAVQGTSQTGTTTGLIATFQFNVTALGGTMTQPGNNDFSVVFASTTGATVAASSVSVQTIPNNAIADGSTAQVTVTATLNNTGTVGSGLYSAAISSIHWTVGSNSVTQTYGLDDFKTPNAVNFLR